MKTIEQVSLKGKKVLIRVDFNLPLDESLTITDDSRMVASLPTIKKVVSDGGMAIIMSHLGRPKGVFEKRFSLKNIVPRLSSLLDAPVCFSNDCVGESVVDDVRKMKNGDILVLENLRFHNEEVGGDEVAVLHQQAVHGRERELDHGVVVTLGRGGLHGEHRLPPRLDVVGPQLDHVVHNTQHQVPDLRGRRLADDDIERLQEHVLELERPQLVLLQELHGQLLQRVDGVHRDAVVGVAPDCGEELGQRAPGTGPHRAGPAGHAGISHLHHFLQREDAGLERRL